MSSVANTPSSEGTFRPVYKDLVRINRNTSHTLWPQKLITNISSDEIANTTSLVISNSAETSSQPSILRTGRSGHHLSSSLAKSSRYIKLASPVALPETHYQSALRSHLSSASHSVGSLADPVSRRHINGYTRPSHSNPSNSPSSSSSSSSSQFSPFSSSVYGYNLAEDRPLTVDIHDLLRKELDQRAKEQKAKFNSSLSSVNLFALLPPKKTELENEQKNSRHNLSNRNSNINRDQSIDASSSSSSSLTTNGHSRTPPGVNILVFKQNPQSDPVFSSTLSTPTDSHYGQIINYTKRRPPESYGLPPRIPPKPNDADKSLSSSPSSSSSDHHRLPNNYQKGHHPIHHHKPNNGGSHFHTSREGEHFGVNYINRLHVDDKSLPGESSGHRPIVVNNTLASSPSSSSPSTTTRASIIITKNSTRSAINNVPLNNVDKKDLDFSSNDNVNNRNDGHSVVYPNLSNGQDRHDYDYDPNNTTLVSMDNENDVDASITGEAYRLTTERLAYILIGSCCALSILCLIIVAFSIRCRDMCDEYKAWKKAEKLAMLNYRYHTPRTRIPGTPAVHHMGSSSIAESNFFSHRNANTVDDSAMNYLPIKTTRPIFGPSCCCCPKPNSTNSAWHTPNSGESCPRGYFHPCPRGKLPFGAASSIQAFPRNMTTTANFASDEDDSLNANVVAGDDCMTGRNAQDGKSTDEHTLAQCTCVDPPNQVNSGHNVSGNTNCYDGELISNRYPQSGNQRKNGHSHHHGPHSSSQHHPPPPPLPMSSSHHHHHHHHPQHQHKTDKSSNPSWLQSSIIVDELHRKHSQMIQEQKNQPTNHRLNSDDQRFIFWSGNQDRLI